MIVQLREYCSAVPRGAAWSVASCSTFLLPSRSVDQPLCPSFCGHLGPVEAVGMETSGPEPRAFSGSPFCPCPPVPDINSQRKESDGPSLDSFLLIPIRRRLGVEVGASVGLPPQYYGGSHGCPQSSQEKLHTLRYFPKQVLTHLKHTCTSKIYISHSALFSDSWCDIYSTQMKH